MQIKVYEYFETMDCEKIFDQIGVELILFCISIFTFEYPHIDEKFNKKWLEFIDCGLVKIKSRAYLRLKRSQLELELIQNPDT